jgi:hypothetical protein
MGIQPIAISFPFSIEMLFYLLLCAFSIHAVFLGYHWFAFGTSKHVSTLALALYLSGGAILFLILATALYL